MKLFPQKWMLPRDLRDGWERCRIGGGGTKALGRAGQRAPVPPAARLGHKEGERKKRSTVAFTSSTQGFALQIQCYQCEEFQLNNDCSSPEFIVNCTVNVQDMCQKEVMEQSAELSSLQKETLYLLVVTNLETSNLLSVSMDLPLPDTSYKWNHTICGLL
ncbi:ly6/PLAUR domain-containing protein 1 isoform X2 [Rhinolophus sinicus]|uniref:ly6/PLAUR domain-containing protein 1 isoform X2 n=1 Tax=Rhinolophus sinicus TaxID=89399 RepID=UPI003D78E192